MVKQTPAQGALGENHLRAAVPEPYRAWHTAQRSRAEQSGAGVESRQELG